MTDPFTFDDLYEVYREEMNGSALSKAREDLYPAIRGLNDRLRGEHERQYAIGPDSDMAEGAAHRLKSAERLSKEVVRIRATKICNMAFLGALGSKDAVETLTPEEREYYRGVKSLSEWMCGQRSGDARPPEGPVPEAPTYGYDPNRPTEADVDAVRAVLRPTWATVSAMADALASDGLGIERYVVRRACKVLEQRGEAVSKDDDGSALYMRAPTAVQQVLPEAVEPRRRAVSARGCVRACLASLGCVWTPTDVVVGKSRAIADKQFRRDQVLDALNYLAREGAVERYPPVVEGRHPKSVEWRRRQ